MVRKIKGDGGPSKKGKRLKRRHGGSIHSNRQCGNIYCKTCYGYKHKE